MTTKNFRVRHGLDVEGSANIDSDILVGGNATITGDLTVNGTTTTLNTQNLLVEDNIVTLNSNVTGTPSTNAGIEIERGDLTNSALTWDESQDKWYQNRAGTSTQIAINTDELSEGSTNQYFTNTRARQAISVTDTNGDGSLSYNNSTGVITYTGPSASEVRAHFSGGTGVTITNGSIAIGQAVGTTDDVVFDQVTATNLVTGAIAPSSGNLTLTTTSTGDINLTTANGGNVVASRNYIHGVVRDTTTDGNGDMWSFGAGTGGAFRGFSVDNSANTAKRPGYVVRSFSGGASNPRTDFIYEVSRGTAASPTAIQQGDFIGEVHATGRTSTGWISDLVTATPAGNTYYATENWVGITNCGAGWGIQLQPTATTLTAGGASRTTVYDTTPEQMYMRNDSMVFSSGKTTQFTATGCNVSGTTLTIGTITSGSVVVGASVQTALQGLRGAYIVANISGSGNGSTWQLSSTQVTLTGVGITGHIGFMGTASGGTTMDMLRTLRIMDGQVRSATNTYALENNAGTDFLTIGSGGITQMLDPAASGNRFIFTPRTASAGGLSQNMFIQQNTNDANGAPLIYFSNRRTTDNVNFTPTQSGDVIGSFRWQGNSATSTTPSIQSGGGNAAVQAVATENWTATAEGTKVVFRSVKNGTTTGIETISASPTNTTFKADTIVLQDSNSTNLAGGKIDYRRTYGCFHKMANVTFAAANTVYAFDWTANTTAHENAQGVTVSNTSRLNIDTAGSYSCDVEMQVKNIENQQRDIWIWLAKNGTDIVESRVKIQIKQGGGGDGDAYQFINKTWLLKDIAANDYIELRYAVNATTNFSLEFEAAQTTPFAMPAQPSATITITPVGA